MATPESKVKEKIKLLCKKYGAYYQLEIKDGRATNGTPDFIICHRGEFAGVEAKAGKGKPTALQYARLLEIRAAGGAAFIINERNLNDLEEWLAELPQVVNGTTFDNLSDWPNPLPPAPEA